MNDIGMRTVASLVLGLYDVLYRRTLKIGFGVFTIRIIASINRKVQSIVFGNYSISMLFSFLSFFQLWVLDLVL